MESSQTLASTPHRSDDRTKHVTDDRTRYEVVDRTFHKTDHRKAEKAPIAEKST